MTSVGSHRTSGREKEGKEKEKKERKKERKKKRWDGGRGRVGEGARSQQRQNCANIQTNLHSLHKTHRG